LASGIFPCLTGLKLLCLLGLSVILVMGLKTNVLNLYIPLLYMFYIYI
jgi:hypothetical protein